MYTRNFRLIRPLPKILKGTLVDLPVPSNLSLIWNFGSLLGLCLVIQILRGVILAIHYTPHIDLAFQSVSHIMRDVNYGWLIRITHANIASFFFLYLYLHIGRGLYYGSYLLAEVWNIGVILFVLCMAVAFLGYVLPWGQIRFWGATVITNLFSAIPVIGKSVVEWLWGGFAISNATLNRFFALHFLLPFVIFALIVVHIFFLHFEGSSNPLGVKETLDKIPFHKYYIVKDIIGFLLFFILRSTLIFFAPWFLGEPDNFIPANSLVTPLHIKPEWYFLWAYAILRSIPNKLGGVVIIFSAVLVLFLPGLLVTQEKKGSSFYNLSQIFFWCFVMIILILTKLGGLPVRNRVELTGQIFTVFFFFFFFIFLYTGKIEDKTFSLT